MPGDSTGQADPRAQPPSSPEVAAFRVLAARSPVESELQGPSMGTTLPAGTRIRIVPLPAEGPRCGRVVAFVAGSRVVVHRVGYLGRGARARGHAITLGDGNWLCDPPIEIAAIAGVVDEAFVGGEWRPAGMPPGPAWNRRVARASLALMAAVLEASPALASRLARAMSYARMGTRFLWSRLSSRSAGP